MSELLYLKASPRGKESASGKLADIFVEKWRTYNPDAIVTSRGVSPDDVEGPDQEWVEANIATAGQRTEDQRRKLAKSDEYIDELRRASHIIIATPMYNFSIPWNLKAYIDNIVREGETFSFSAEEGHGPLLPEGKKLLLLWTAAGDYSPGSDFADYDFLTPTVACTYGFMGVTDFSVIPVGNREEAPELAQATLRACHAQIDQLCTKW